MKIALSPIELYAAEENAALTKSCINPASCDIFCNVIDNYGDIGVSWRLARQLANEFRLNVRMWVDDLASFARLCPEADAALEIQNCRGVEVRLWHADAFNPLPAYRPPSPASGESEVRGAEPAGAEGTAGEANLSNVIPADLVIEAFSCTLPESYLAAMMEIANKSDQSQAIWINLEYLSAENWVEGCHKLPSPRPPLTRYFFFPGFTKRTGGLLLERDLLARRDAFLNDELQQKVFWKSIGMQMPAADTLKISLFAYENAALEGLFDAWVSGEQPVLCLVPEGRILPQVVQYFADAMPVNSPLPPTGEGVEERACYSRGNLQVRVLPFVEQELYDELLWACDINFVRGEDSCVRAQWAGKPFVWQIYPQHDAVHWEKLQAFLDLYDAALSPEAARAMQGLWRAWNGGAGGVAWAEFDAARAELDERAKSWARELSENNLALNLLDFFQEIGRMRAFEIEGQ
ncbi:MAG: elongation factor P maturation arginine rhamnosyltransferase EarP [Gallionella sp.]|nr:elongation factor P maturation arginine rhamnosyltransferase EarP [Gallionella sp.]